MRISSTVSAALLTIATTGLVGLGAFQVGKATVVDNTPTAEIVKNHEFLPACEYEDGSTQDVCLWDASVEGNGYGDSFISLNYGKRVVYIETGEVVDFE